MSHKVFDVESGISSLKSRMAVKDDVRKKEKALVSESVDVFLNLTDELKQNYILHICMV